MPGQKRKKPQKDVSASLWKSVPWDHHYTKKQRFEVSQHRKSFNKPWDKIHKKRDFISSRAHRTCYHSACLATSNFRQLFFLHMWHEV